MLMRVSVGLHGEEMEKAIEVCVGDLDGDKDC